MKNIQAQLSKMVTFVQTYMAEEKALDKAAKRMEKALKLAWKDVRILRSRANAAQSDAGFFSSMSAGKRFAEDAKMLVKDANTYLQSEEMDRLADLMECFSHDNHDDRARREFWDESMISLFKTCKYGLKKADDLLGRAHKSLEKAKKAADYPKVKKPFKSTDALKPEFPKAKEIAPGVYIRGDAVEVKTAVPVAIFGSGGRITEFVPNPDFQEKHPEAKPKRCPTCDSPKTTLHPAVQWEGEVTICSNAWHLDEKATEPMSVERMKQLAQDEVECRWCDEPLSEHSTTQKATCARMLGMPPVNTESDEPEGMGDGIVDPLHSGHNEG